jgi:polar amino acid transport system permease protein
MDYQFQFNVIWQNWRLFLEGIKLTIQITSIATGLGLLIGMIMAGLQLMKNRALSSVIQVYIEIIRNTPFLVQLFFVFFGLPTLGIKLQAGHAALIALTINIGAYATEIVRAGIEAISKGQIEAGRSLGLSGFQIFIYIILKPALMTVYPALTSQFILIMLNSSVISVISAQELAYQAKYLQSRTFRSFEIYFFVTLLYLLLAYLFRTVFGLISKVAFGKARVNYQ